MKIVDRKTFLSLPPGTVFAKYEPMVFGDLEIKGGNCGDNDYFYQDITAAVDARHTEEMFDRLERSREHGESVPMDFYIQGRDGLYDDEQLFAVYEPADVRELIQRLTKALNESTEGLS